MKAMVLKSTGKAEDNQLHLEDMPMPSPEANDVLVKVDFCGVCRTDLHVIEGDLPPQASKIIPGHQIVGRIVQVGTSVHSLSVGDLIGIPWLHHTCGSCEYCTTGRENLCDNTIYTGYTVNGGYAQYAVGVEGFVFPLPSDVESSHLAPLICAGIIGYRAFKVTSTPLGGRIGFFGFGGSAHITLQLASKLGYETVAFSRNHEHLKLARELGASETIFTGVPQKRNAKPIDSAIVFAPSGAVVLDALALLKKGGTLSISAIHMTPIPEMDYDKFLFGEKKIVSVEANTRADAKEFLTLANRLNLQTRVTVGKLEEANEALTDLKKGNVDGSFVLDCT